MIDLEEVCDLNYFNMGVFINNWIVIKNPYKYDTILDTVLWNMMFSY